MRAGFVVGGLLSKAHPCPVFAAAFILPRMQASADA
jgi:hypothetical protein